MVESDWTNGLFKIGLSAQFPGTDPDAPAACGLPYSDALHMF